MELRIKPEAYLATNNSFRYITINATKPRRHQIRRQPAARGDPYAVAVKSCLGYRALKFLSFANGQADFLAEVRVRKAPIEKIVAV